MLKSIEQTNNFAVAATGDKIQFLNKANLHFKISLLSWNHHFMVAPKLPVEVILGSDFLHKSKAVINMKEFKVTFPYGSGHSMAITPNDDINRDTEAPFKVGEQLNQEQTQKVKDLVAQFPDTITKKGRQDEFGRVRY